MGGQAGRAHVDAHRAGHPRRPGGVLQSPGVQGTLSIVRGMRAKFVLLGTASIIVVLTLILGIAEMTIYAEIVDTADHTLTLLADSNGSFPEDPRTYGLYDDRITKETPYESIWFLVRRWDAPEDGNKVAVDTAKTAAVDEQAAEDYALAAEEDGHAFGFVGTFRYIHRDMGDGDMFVFLDRGRQIQSFKRGLFATIAIAGMGVLTFMAILALASKRVMRPFEENQAKQREFITNAGHDIKTPLTIIAADADVLSFEIGSDNEWLVDIKRQVEELTKLTNDLILLSRMEEDRGEREDIPFDLSATLASVADSFEVVAQSEGKSIERDLPDGITVVGDEKMLRKLAGVLIDNALKYSDDGGTVGVALSRRRRSVSLSVTNTVATTEGMDVSRWFDRFYQEDSARSHGREGFGIGLSVAQAVVAAHGGQIRPVVQGRTVELVATMPIATNDAK